ncbi:MAG: cytochrome c3 family protein [Chloroflexi bacterium]|nr:cytochrome c3 family protein [Chloroflexota bacterium]
MRQPPKLLHPPQRWTFSMVIGIGLFLFTLIALVSPAQAAPAYQEDKPSNDFCLACHQEKGLDKSIGKETLPVTINPIEFGLSVHAEENIACVDCHTNISDYPHPDVKVKTIRDFSLELYTSCKECHEDQYELTQDSVHQRAFDEGNINAAICTDCHNPHTQTRLTGQQSGELTPAARLHIPGACAQCHSTVYDQYKDSVHGTALTEENNVDVPTCIDCHGVHNIQSPTTVTFRNSTPGLCAKCHTDPDIMDKYGISTHVLDTYVADFHGSTVKLFEEQYPDQPTNKPVCTDCHGIHDIVKVNDPEAGIALRENLLAKCQRCHPDATANFPGAWMSHYAASPTENPLVYYVNLFYKFFIPAVLGGMTLFVITDIYRRIVNRRKEGKHK